MAFEPENELERSLMQANTHPAHRPQFYRDLAESEVFVITGDQPSDRSGPITLEAGQTVALVGLQSEGKEWIPFFSSLTRLQMFAKREVRYLRMNVLNLFNLTKGAELVLNPASDYGKTFLPQEIAAVLDGSIWKPEQHVVKKEVQVELGEPAVYPKKLTDTLIAFFKKSKSVERAYLAHYYNPDDGQKAHTLIGIEVSGNWDRVIGDVGVVVNSTTDIPDPPVDVVQITGKGSMDSYFLEKSKPFYERKRFGLF